jgi:phage shock protein B
MLAMVISHFASLAIPIVAIVCAFAFKALRVCRRYPPAQPDFSAEDRAKISRITEMIDKMESRVAALETLLREEQANKVITHEEAT